MKRLQLKRQKKIKKSEVKRLNGSTIALAGISNDLEVGKDALFLDKMQDVFSIKSFLKTYKNARKSLKKRVQK